MKKHLLILSFILVTSLTFGQTAVYETWESDTPDLGDFTYDGEGTFNEAATPPTGNSSTYCLYYLRNSGAGNYENIQYTLDRKLDDVASFATATPGANVFKIKIATMDVIGTEIRIKLESSTSAGHHSEYTATTTKTNNEWETLTFAWDPAQNGTLAASEVDRLIIFPAFNTTSGAEFFFDDLEGPALVAATSVKDVISLVSDSKLYPNPASEMGRVELSLKSSSEVKVTLSNMMGKEVAVIAEETTASLDKSFSVAELAQGLYTVNYYINGAPAKAELLMVK